MQRREFAGTDKAAVVLLAKLAIKTAINTGKALAVEDKPATPEKAAKKASKDRGGRLGDPRKHVFERKTWVLMPYPLKTPAAVWPAEVRSSRSDSLLRSNALA